MTICPATTTVIASNTCEMPPVGSGRAGRNIRKSTVTAKLFSANTSPRSPMVFVPSLLSQSSSWTLNGMTSSSSGVSPSRSSIR